MTAVAKPLYVRIGERRWPAASVEDASAMFCAVRDRSGRGGSTTPRVFICDDARDLFEIYYNGRVWTLDAPWPDNRCVYNPNSSVAA